MKITKDVGRRAGSLFTALALLAAVAAPAALTSSASAAQITSRSAALSSSKASEVDVTYDFSFTLTGTAASLVIVFCSNSPIISEACTAPTGLNTSSADTTEGGTVTYDGNNVIKYAEASMTGAKTITFTDIDNPSSTGTFYAKVATYTNGTFGTYVSEDNLGTPLDSGGIAMAITNPIEVSAAVRETMTFCVSAAAPTTGCGGVTSPAIELGEGTPKALSTSTASTADVYTQISTNASGGAIVRMKINNQCGGLKRAEASASVCDIAPIGTGTHPLTSAGARFGVRVQTPVNVGSDFAGSVDPGANYEVSGEYGMNWVSGNATGVGSTYGDPVYDTNEAPINDINVPLRFAARAAITTPAGLYRADMNMVATGTF